MTIELFQRGDHQPVEVKSTGVQSGENPTWNEVFLFSLSSTRLNDHYVDFTGNTGYQWFMVTLVYNFGKLRG